MTTAAKIEFKASAQFNPVFRPVNEWRGRYRILKGSAGSGKSVNIAQDYIAKLSDPAYTGANLLVVRKIEETNRDSTFAELQAAIYRMDLDADCDSLGTELKDTFRRLKLFIDVYFQITGQGDFTNEEFDIVFNMDLPVNETDIINNAVNSNGLLSKRTILQNHPWVTDVDEELARIDEEKKAAMEEYGDGLFNHAMGADDSQEGGDSAGLNGGDGNDE